MKNDFNENSAVKNIIGILFPEKCASCGRYLEREEHYFCMACAADIKRVVPPYSSYARKERAYELAVAPFYYSGSIKNAIGRLKFSSDEHVSEVLGREMSHMVNSLLFGVKIDVITCVPCTKSSISQRGYNQSQSLAECITLNPSMWRENSPPLRDWHLLTKDKTVNVQHLLPAEIRRRNIESAYHLNKGREVSGKNILLVDDILTTGATAEACARELVFKGADRVFVAVAAIGRIN